MYVVRGGWGLDVRVFILRVLILSLPLSTGPFQDPPVGPRPNLRSPCFPFMGRVIGGCRRPLWSVEEDGVRGETFRHYGRDQPLLYSGYSVNRDGSGDLHYSTSSERRIPPVSLTPASDLVPRGLPLVLSENSSFSCSEGTRFLSGPDPQEPSSLILEGGGGRALTKGIDFRVND